MLVITRKLNEGIIIDEDIEIVIVGMEDGKVKLGINAPHSIKVYRKEIYEAIKQENKEAVQIGKDALSYLINRQESE